MKRQIIAALGLFGVVLGTGLGCELITAPDRSKIDNGGAGGTTITGGGGTGGVTGGTGGVTGGTGGTGGTTGTPCDTVADCDPPNVCVDATCEMGFCVFAAKADGPQAMQTPGDCKVSQCTKGLPMDVADDADLPDDANDCTVDVCKEGNASHTNADLDTACGVNLMLKCDGAGNCVDCTVAEQCGTDTECQQHTCTAGVCGVVNTMQGVALADQATGDCQLEQCDGAGSTETVDDNADIPADLTTCTNDVCVLGVPSNIPVSASTPCAEGNGTLCDGTGSCVQCVAGDGLPRRRRRVRDAHLHRRRVREHLRPGEHPGGLPDRQGLQEERLRRRGRDHRRERRHRSPRRQQRLHHRHLLDGRQGLHQQGLRHLLRRDPGVRRGRSVCRLQPRDGLPRRR